MKRVYCDTGIDLVDSRLEEAPEGGNVQTVPMQARMNHPAFVVPGAMDALQSLGKAVQESGVSPKLLELMSLRASQINGCGVCAVQHPQIARKLGETDERIFAVTAWRDAPFFTDAERAALALTEASTRIADSSDPVPDEVWEEAARHFNEQELGALILAIASINVWNRLNVATRQVAGQAW
ncbi:MAG: carboxymuconolactone decarboxylase family protein [Nitrolancea sp.]